MRYAIADPSEYLAITGANVARVKITKKAIVYPLQRVLRISIRPFDLSLNLQAMTLEKLQFSLPAVFTIGPYDEMASLEKYAGLLTDHGEATATGGVSHVQDIVRGIIEGETRVIVSSMTMEEIFKERQLFKQKIRQNVQSELDQFGLHIYNANVKELQDTPGSEYFAVLSRKAHEGALNQAKVDVAEARMLGYIGEAEKESKTKQEVSRIDAETAVLETQRKSEKATADAQLTTRETELNMGISLAKIKAKREAEVRDTELQRVVETKRAEMELERLRAKDVTQSRIARESAQETADAGLYTHQKKADAKLYERRQDAEAELFKSTKDIDIMKAQVEAACSQSTQEADVAVYGKEKQSEAAAFAKQRDADAEVYNKEKEADAAAYTRQKGADAAAYAREKEANVAVYAKEKDADATVYATMKEIDTAFYRKQKEAEAMLYTKQKQAEGLRDMAQAYGCLADVLGGPTGLLQYLMLENNTYEKLATANAKAIQGLQPKITSWNTGGGGGGGDAATGGPLDSSTAPIRNILQSLPPLLTTIHDQTGVAPPSWLARMPELENRKGQD